MLNKWGGQLYILLLKRPTVSYHEGEYSSANQIHMGKYSFIYNMCVLLHSIKKQKWRMLECEEDQYVLPNDVATTENKNKLSFKLNQRTITFLTIKKMQIKVEPHFNLLV